MNIETAYKLDVSIEQATTIHFFNNFNLVLYFFQSVIVFITMVVLIIVIGQRKSLENYYLVTEKV